MRYDTRTYSYSSGSIYDDICRSSNSTFIDCFHNCWCRLVDSYQMCVVWVCPSVRCLSGVFVCRLFAIRLVSCLCVNRLCSGPVTFVCILSILSCPFVCCPFCVLSACFCVFLCVSACFLRAVRFVWILFFLVFALNTYHRFDVISTLLHPE